MTLSVNVRVYDETGELTKIELENGKDLAGFENCRYNLYGSPLAASLGFRLLPELKESDLYVEAEELDELQNELETLLAKIDEFSRISDLTEEYIEARVRNILAAVRIAKNNRGQVIIW